MLRFVLVASTLLGSWLGMQAVHELGHVLAAKWTGRGIVRYVDLHPLRISHTNFLENQDPRTIAWGGPLFGVIFPLLPWGVAAGLRLPGAFVLRFFAGFCLIANGLYLGVDSFTQAGDGGDLVRNGAVAWQLWLFAALTVPTGFMLWYGQGTHFGLGLQPRLIAKHVAFGTLIVFLALIALGLVFDGS